MNQSIRRICLTATAACGLLFSPASAQTTATTDPVGAMTFEVDAKSDLHFGVSLQRPSLFSGKVLSVNGNTLVLDGSFTQGEFTVEPSYLRVTSGSAEGHWFSVVSNDGTSVQVGEDLSSYGISSDDEVQIKRFWTVGTLFPEGGGIPGSPNVFDPEAILFLSDVLSVGINPAPSVGLLYHSGEQAASGWYDASAPNVNEEKSGVLVTQETILTVRNRSNQAASINLSGAVPNHRLGTFTVSYADSSQDNELANPYPVSFTLGSSGLVSSGAVRPSPNVFDPVDVVFVYGGGNAGYNPAPVGAFLYHSGEQAAAGWYDASSPNVNDEKSQFIVDGGVAITVRRDDGQTVEDFWLPPVPY